MRICSGLIICTEWRGLVALFGILFLFPRADLAAAGQETAASVIGQVRDESGGVLPGVTVTATSPALQVPSMTSVTDERGEYRLTPLPIGTYAVEYALAGFQTVRHEALRLTIGFAAKIDVMLKVGALAETITVSGASPVVDVTSTAATTQFTKETLEALPTSRNGLISLLAQAPGVRANLDIGGSSMVSQPAWRAFGQDAESWQTLEGVVTTSPRDGQFGNYWDYSVFDEAQVRTVGNGADVPSRGVRLSAIVKSGGNSFHGGGFWAQTNDRLQGDNINERLRAQGVTSGGTLETRWDLSGELGGKIVQDKVWFYGSARRRRNVVTALNAFKPDGTPAEAIQDQGFHTEKLSYQMTPGNRLVGFHQRAMKNELRAISRFQPWESRIYTEGHNHTAKVEWQAVRGSALVMTLQQGLFKWDNFYFGFAPGKVPTLDVRTLFTSGDSIIEANSPGLWQHHTTGTVSWYRPDLFLGNHELKTGFDYLQFWDRRQFGVRQSGNYRLLFDGGVPFEIQTYNYPIKSLSVSRYLGLYATDSWTMRRRLTLNLGVRYAHDTGVVPPQCVEAGDFVAAECFPKVQMNTWNTVTPRLHAAYDVSGDGKTVIKGGWGRFVHKRELEQEVNPTNRNLATATTWLWHDRNGNSAYDPGEVNLDPNGPDFVQVQATSPGPEPGAIANAVPNPNEQQPKTAEFSLSFERELMPNLAVRITGLHTRNFNTYRLLTPLRPYEAYDIPITNRDPGPDGVVGTPDDPGTSVTYYDYPVALAGKQFGVITLANDPQGDYTYKSVEVAASKRLAGRWQLMMSYSATKKNIPFGSEQLPLNPNAEINVADRTWEWLGKVSSAYLFPYGMSASANFEHRSGNPQARTVLFRGGRQIPSIVLPVEPLGTIRLPNLNLLDLRVEKTIRLTAEQKVAVRLNVFNALNVNSVTARTVRSGASYLLPTGIVPPRILELSASYAF